MSDTASRCETVAAAARPPEVERRTTGAADGEARMRLLSSEFDRCYGTVHRYLQHRLFDGDLAEELTAQTFYQAATSADGLPGDSRRLLFWLLRTATNLANTHQRRTRLRRLLLGDRVARRAATQAPVGQTGLEESARVRAALLGLRPKYQSVVVLRFYSRMPMAEIAAVVGCREPAVRARLSRAIKELRERLGDIARH